MTGVITYMLTYDRLPPVDAQLRPKMFYGQRNHDKCYRRAHFDAGQFVEKFDDIGAKLGYCLYKVGARDLSLTTPALLSVGTTCCLGRLNPDIRAWPAPKTTSGIRGSFYAHEPTILPPSWGLGIQATADRVGLAALGVMGAAVAVHASRKRRRSRQVKRSQQGHGSK